MSWHVHARRTHEHGAHLKVRWGSLASIDDVSIDCPRGVHATSRRGVFRREMNAFTDAIDVHLSWGEEVEHPCVTLSWTDAGEQCQRRLSLESMSTRHRLSFGQAASAG